MIKAKAKLAKDDLLFHATHGLCRVTAVTASGDSKEISYFLFPVSANRGKVRFIIPLSSFEESGFNKLISTKEANAILDYFKTGTKKESQSGQAWTQAVLVWSESSSGDRLKDKKRRQMLEEAIKSISAELAFALNQPAKETAQQILKNLGAPSKVNPLVTAVLSNVEND